MWPFPARLKRVPRSVPAPDQKRDLLLYKHDTCGYCVKVRRAAERLGVVLELADIRAQVDHRRTLLARTGRTQVPCLFIDGQPLLESDDIVAWLEAYATGGTRP